MPYFHLVLAPHKRGGHFTVLMGSHAKNRQNRRGTISAAVFNQLLSFQLLEKEKVKNKKKIVTKLPFENQADWSCCWQVKQCFTFVYRSGKLAGVTFKSSTTIQPRECFLTITCASPPGHRALPARELLRKCVLTRAQVWTPELCDVTKSTDRSLGCRQHRHQSVGSARWDQVVLSSLKHA